MDSGSFQIIGSGGTAFGSSYIGGSASIAEHSWHGPLYINVMGRVPFKLT